jgi:hypothetical protein
MELVVTKKDVRRARSISNQRQKEIDLLQDELGKQAYLAQANLKKIVDKFREKTNAEIQVTMATALQSWSEQAAELRVLRADKANRELRGTRFWKLDKANYEAVQKNLTTEFMWIALTHREEITKLLVRQEETVRAMHAEMEAAAEPVVPAALETGAPEEKEEDDDVAEPSLLNVLNED